MFERRLFELQCALEPGSYFGSVRLQADGWPAKPAATTKERENTVTKKPNVEHTAKRRYEKPEITQVSLRAEEAVLGVCKSASGPPVSGHGNCSATPRCSSVGS